MAQFLPQKKCWDCSQTFFSLQDHPLKSENDEQRIRFRAPTGRRQEDQARAQGASTPARLLKRAGQLGKPRAGDPCGMMPLPIQLGRRYGTVRPRHGHWRQHWRSVDRCIDEQPCLFRYQSVKYNFFLNRIIFRGVAGALNFEQNYPYLGTCYGLKDKR